MMRELDADHAYLAASALALFASSFLLIELLRDWLDPRSFVHTIATVLVALSAAPAMLLPPDHSRHSETDAGVSLFAMYEIARWSMLALFFVVAPATLTFAGASRRDVRNQACCAAGAGLLLCIALSLVTPLITLWIPDSGRALNLPSGQWASDLFAWQRSGAPVVPGGGSVIAGSSSAPQDKVPRALLDGPLAFALLAGACLLATHGANGAVALPRLLAPPSRGKGPRPNRRARSNTMLLANLRQQLEATREERRALASQFDLRGRSKGKAQQQRQASLEHREAQLVAQIAGVGGSTSKLASAWAEMSRLRLAATVVLVALALFVSASLATSLGLHAARSPCGLACGFLLPPGQARAIDADASAGAAVDAAVAAAVPLSGGLTTGFTNTTALATRQTATTAAIAAAAAAALPFDALLIRLARTPPLDAVLIFVLMALVLSWVVTSSAVGCGVCGGKRRARSPSGWAIRYRGSSGGALIVLAMRLALCATSFGAMLLTLAPRYTRAVSEYGVPGLSVAARSILAIIVRLPFFGMVWYAAQCVVAACLLGHLLVRALIWTCRKLQGPSRHSGSPFDDDDDDDDYGSDDEDDERTPLNRARSP
jgi:hypothetical protein